MGKISVFNYEIFYLDYLEGNLNEKDTSLLFAFLEQHPELKMEDEDLPFIEERKISFSKKDSLKHPLYSDEITENNIEYFLIAQVEGLLSTKEEEKVNQFIKEHPVFKKEQQLIGMVYLKSNDKVVYKHKNALKKKKTIVLWPYISIAASVFVAFLLWNSSQNKTLNVVTAQQTNKQINKSQTKEQIKAIKEERDEQIKTSKNSTKSTSVPPTLIIHSNENKTKTVENNPTFVDVDSLPYQKTQTAFDETPSQQLIISNYQELKPVTSQTSYNPDNITENTVKSDDYMTNPIEPITAFLEKKTNTVIQYKKQERTENQPKKTFIKIGRFEFYRKKH